jgi:hypothetical protein
VTIERNNLTFQHAKVELRSLVVGLRFAVVVGVDDVGSG